MDVTLSGRIKNAWNAFVNKQPPQYDRNSYYYGSSSKPDRVRLSRGNERSILTSVLNRISLDVAAVDIKHCQLDQNGRFQKVIESPLNNCLSLEANLDQTSRAFIQDLVMSMFDEGCAVVVPIDTNVNPTTSKEFDILTMRVGKVTEWYPTQVKVLIYNDRTGIKEEITLPKNKVAIIENPLYAIMNEPNSTLRRLTRKLVLLDSIDEQTSSGKLDLIIQLPYVVKSQSRKDQANERRGEIERQLTGSKYGIAYTDGTEKITQLNRPVENNLMKQVEYLTSMLYSQLGITTSILDGTADETTMINYNARTVEPIVTSIVLEIKRKFLSKAKRDNGETIESFKDPFKLVPVSKLAELSDKFTRNEILSSNEIRGIIGYKPSSDPKADQLINSNLNQSRFGATGSTPMTEMSKEETEDQRLNRVMNTLSDEQRLMIEDMIKEAINNESK